MNNSDIIEIAERGLWRFYDEGYYRWPREKLQSFYSNTSLDNPEVKKSLSYLEKKGFIKLVREADCYIEVLDAP